jgi:hypothetical protein
VDSVGEVRSRVRNGPVEKPVGGGGHRKGLGSDLQGEDLTSDNPSARAPRTCEEEDIDANEGDKGLLGSLVGDWQETNASNDKLTDSHADSSKKQELSSAPLLDQVQTREGGGNIDTRGNQTDGKSVADAGTLEERCTVVEDEVDTTQLLESLKTATGSETLAEISLEAVDVAGLSK